MQSICFAGGCSHVPGKWKDEFSAAVNLFNSLACQGIYLIFKDGGAFTMSKWTERLLYVAGCVFREVGGQKRGNCLQINIVGADEFHSEH